MQSTTRYSRRTTHLFDRLMDPPVHHPPQNFHLLLVQVIPVVNDMDAGGGQDVFAFWEPVDEHE